MAFLGHFWGIFWVFVCYDACLDTTPGERGWHRREAVIHGPAWSRRCSIGGRQGRRCATPLATVSGILKLRSNGQVEIVV